MEFYYFQSDALTEGTIEDAIAFVTVGGSGGTKLYKHLIAINNGDYNILVISTQSTGYVNGLSIKMSPYVNDGITTMMYEDTPIVGFRGGLNLQITDYTGASTTVVNSITSWNDTVTKL